MSIQNVCWFQAYTWISLLIESGILTLRLSVFYAFPKCGRTFPVAHQSVKASLHHLPCFRNFRNIFVYTIAYEVPLHYSPWGVHEGSKSNIPCRALRLARQVRRILRRIRGCDGAHPAWIGRRVLGGRGDTTFCHFEVQICTKNTLAVARIKVP
jgi:hypothetical protein